MVISILISYNSLMDKTCPTCNEIFSKKSYNSKKVWNERIYCSVACSGTTFKKGHKLSESTIETLRSRKGIKNHNFKGKSWVGNQGYVIKSLETGGNMLEHRYVMEQHIDRKLMRNEHVHHLNGIRTDNRIENLVIINPRDHGRYHALQRWSK